MKAFSQGKPLLLPKGHCEETLFLKAQPHKGFCVAVTYYSRFAVKPEEECVNKAGQRMCAQILSWPGLQWQ